MYQTDCISYTDLLEEMAPILCLGIIADKTMIYDSLTADYSCMEDASNIEFNRYLPMSAGIPGDRPPIFDNQKLFSELKLRASRLHSLYELPDTISQALFKCSNGVIKKGTADIIAISICISAAEKTGIISEPFSDDFKQILDYFGYPVKVDFSAEEIMDKVDADEVLLTFPESPGEPVSRLFKREDLFDFIDLGLERRSGPMGQ